MKKFLQGLFFASQVFLFAQTGTKMTNFGDGGVVISPVMQTNLDDFPRAIAVFTDNKLITTGYSTTFDQYHAYLAKYNTDGTLDTSFGNGGKVINNESFFTQYADVIAENDGKVVVCGVKTTIFSSQGHDCFVARYNANGTLDTTFGNGGFFTTALSASTDGLMRIVKLNDGRYVCLARYGSGAAGIAALLMLTSNGVLDGSFGNGGIKTHLFSTTNPQGISDLAISNDDNIMALGGGDGVVKMVKIDLNGAVVASFGNNGAVVVPTGRHLRILNDGSILVMGEIITGPVQMTNYKYLSNGTIDTSFGSGGTSVYSADGLTNVSGFASRPLLYPDGKFMRGWRHTIVTNGETQHRTALTWFNADGSLSDIGTVIEDISPNPEDFSDQMPEHIVMDTNGDVYSYGYFQDAMLRKQYIMKFKGYTNLSNHDIDTNRFTIFPNPFSDNLSILSGSQNSTIKTISVYNHLGSLVSEILSPVENINLSFLANGLYLFKIKDINNEVSTYKIVKE